FGFKKSLVHSNYFKVTPSNSNNEIETFHRASYAPPPPSPPRPLPNYEAFGKRKVEDFNGDRSTDLAMVDRWLSNVTRSLQEMRGTNEDMVLLTVSLLQEAAYDWWLTQPASQHEPPTIT
ncbi:hypothetical protein LINPERHAP1_LOCUS14103, partial [Linum perenne]